MKKLIQKIWIVRFSYHISRKFLHMIKIDHNVVEEEIIKVIKDLNSKLNIEAEINSACVPGAVGFSSQVLITVMGLLEEKLGILIPNECYIFHDKVSLRKLTIEEAASKLIKIAKYAKQ